MQSIFRHFSMVSKAWGYFMWVNRFLYVSSDGSESNPRVPFSYDSGRWLKLKTVVDGVNVKIYVNGSLIHELVMQGQDADSETENYVGLWCHRLVFIAGKDFQVSSRKFPCRILYFRTANYNPRR